MNITRRFALSGSRAYASFFGKAIHDGYGTTGKRVVASILLLLSTLLLSSCSAPDNGALRFGLSKMPVTLDPRFATDATSSRINRLLYQRLVDFDDASMPAPSLATWQKLTPLHYRFTLNSERAPFSNGEPLTSADVQATYAFILDSTNASPHRLSLGRSIERIETKGDDVIDFILKEADLLFPGRLGIGILPKQLIESKHAFNRSPLGSGAYQLATWPDDTHLRLKRRSDDLLLEFIEVTDPNVRVLKLMRGEIDMMQNDLPPELIRYLSQESGVTITHGAGSNFAYLGFNMEDEFTGVQQVREAISLALDRESIIQYVMGESARPANALLPPDHWAGAPKLHQIAYDPEAATALMINLGYSVEKPLHLTYKTSSDPFRLRLATVIQQQLSEIGIKVELKSYDWGTFYGDIKAGRFQMYSLMWVGIKLPDIFRYVFHSTAIPPEGANRGRFIDAETDRLIETAEAATSIEVQAELYQQLQGHLLQQLPFVPLWYEDHVFIARDHVSGYTIARDGNYDGLLDVRKVK